VLITVLVLSLGIALIVLAAGIFPEARFAALCWVSALAIIHAWLAYLWKCDALEWEVAYERDVQQSKALFQFQKEPLRQIQLWSPKTGFGGQFPVVLIPSTLERLETSWCLDCVRNVSRRNSHNIRIAVYAASSGLLPVLSRSNSPKSPFALVQSQDGISAGLVSNYQNQSEATPIEGRWGRFGMETRVTSDGLAISQTTPTPIAS